MEGDISILIRVRVISHTSQFDGKPNSQDLFGR